MILIVGATGVLGGEICRLLAARGDSIRALVRRTSSTERIDGLKKLGAELVQGDLKDHDSLRRACRGAGVVVSTASSTISRQAGDTIESVDRQGQLDLIDAAEAEGVRRFVLISFPGTETPFPVQDAKRAVEERLRRGRIEYVILQPTFFTEVWLSPHLGFDAPNGRVQIFGDGQNAISWISCLDVAACAAAAVHAPGAANQTLKLGGPDALSPLEIVGMAERLLGKKIAVQQVPEDALRAQLAAAGDSLQKSMPGLMLYYAHGDIIDSGAAERALGVRPRRSVREFLQAGTA